MYADGGPDVEYGQTRAEEKETFSEKEYASDDPNDDENGYKGDYNTVDTDRPDGEDAEEANEGAEHDGDVEPESFVQLKSKSKSKKQWGNMMYADGGPDVEYGQTRAEEKETFSEKEYASDDPNDDENGYTGDYNTADTDHPDGEDEEEANEGAEHDGDVEPEAFLQVKTKHAYKKKKKGWGNLMDSDGGDEVEYGQQTVAEQNDFSEKQYESNDPNDDENGYDGDYNTPDTDHPDGEDEEESEAEEEEDKKEGDDDNEDSFIQARSKTQTKHASK